MTKDERLIANQTTSLCLPHAKDLFRVGFQRLAGAPPALLLLSTDGYANSYRAEADFLRSGSDLLALIRAESVEWVERRLEGWLTETSENGSGDDITLGIVAHLPSLQDSGQHLDSDAAHPATNELRKHDGNLEQAMPELEKQNGLSLKRLARPPQCMIGLFSV